MKLQILFLIFSFFTTTITAQVLLDEKFESNTIPDGWRVESNATDGGWKFESVSSISSGAFGIQENGSLGIAGTNDDDCNCDKSNEYLITSAIDLSTVPAALLKFDLFFGDQTYQGSKETGTVEISLDNENWMTIYEMPATSGWETIQVDLFDFVGESTVYIGFKYDDGFGWLYGCGIDNVYVGVPPNLDGAIESLDIKPFGLVGQPVDIAANLVNNGSSIISSFDIKYNINGQDIITEKVENITFGAFQKMNYTFENPWIPTEEMVADIIVTISNINGMDDEGPFNNEFLHNISIYGDVLVPNRILEIVNSTPELIEIANSSNNLDRPNDLDFHPVLGKDELWIVNERNENDGGSTVTIQGATTGDPSAYDFRVDGNAWHFMSIPTGIAFSPENYNFATSPGVKDANHSGGTFTGPTLWSSDPEIYAMPSGGNGSHLDMLHGSPFSMGIAHEIDNVFWVYDDWNKDIVRYDFVEDHGPGNDDHSDGKLKRYSDIGITRDADVPNHMILDKDSGWLYFVDNGNDRVLRLDINSGQIGQDLPNANEPLDEHSRMADFDYEVIISEGLERPCGIELMEQYLLVGDYENGDISVFDITSNFEMVGKISTGHQGLTGLKVGPDGNIYTTNKLQNTATIIREGKSLNTEEISNHADFTISPNPASNFISVELENIDCKSNLELKVFDMVGAQKVFKPTMKNCDVLDISGLNPGVYLINIRADNKTYSKLVSKN